MDGKETLDSTSLDTPSISNRFSIPKGYVLRGKGWETRSGTLCGTRTRSTTELLGFHTSLIDTCFHYIHKIFLNCSGSSVNLRR